MVGLSATVFPIDIVSELLGTVWSFLGFEIDITPEVGWLLLLLGDALLVAGSLLPGSDEVNGRTNFAPRLRTIIVALVLMVIGMLGTFVGALPELAGIHVADHRCLGVPRRRRRPGGRDGLRGHLTPRCARLRRDVL